MKVLQDYLPMDSVSASSSTPSEKESLLQELQQSLHSDLRPESVVDEAACLA